MSQMGRPTNEPKTISTHIRFSEEDIRRVDYCAKLTGMTRSDIIRQGIKEMYDRLKEEK